MFTKIESKQNTMSYHFLNKLFISRQIPLKYDTQMRLVIVIIIFLFIYSTKYQFISALCSFDDNPCQFGQECEDFGDFKMCFCDDQLYQGEFCEIISK